MNLIFVGMRVFFGMFRCQTWASAGGVKRAFAQPPLELWTKNEKFRKILKSEA